MTTAPNIAGMLAWHQNQGKPIPLPDVNVRMPLRESGDCGILAPHFTSPRNSLIT